MEQQQAPCCPGGLQAAGMPLSGRKAEIMPLNSDQANECLTVYWSWSQQFLFPSLSWSQICQYVPQ